MLPRDIADEEKMRENFAAMTAPTRMLIRAAVIQAHEAADFVNALQREVAGPVQRQRRRQ